MIMTHGICLSSSSNFFALSEIYHLSVNLNIQMCHEILSIYFGVVKLDQNGHPN